MDDKNFITKDEIDTLWLGALDGTIDPKAASDWATNEIRSDIRIPNQIIFEALGLMQTLDYSLDPARQPQGRRNARRSREYWEKEYAFFRKDRRAWAVRFFGERYTAIAAKLGPLKAEKSLRAMISPPELTQEDVNTILTGLHPEDKPSRLEGS